MAHHTDQHRIVVLGAGYTGMMCAIRVARRTRGDRARVTLVNPSGRFTERLRMHQIATGQHLAEVSIPEILAGTGVEFVQGRASRIDPATRQVCVDTVDGQRLFGYDSLVYAIGSVTDTTTVPGVDAHA
jgi:NADH dehydrogenase FAD-containing subunit